jgi:uncharacterized membrane protein YjfL (UPF0719 family)
MSGDEVMLWVVSGVLAVGSWWKWFAPTIGVRPSRSAGVSRWLLRLSPLLAAVLLWQVLVHWASADVVGAYRWLYLTFGAAWVGVGLAWLPWLGLSARDDVVERGNTAAGWAVAGALLGLTACFAGANIGNGPGWWVVLFTGGLATATWFGSWLALEFLAQPSESISIERDVASGLRLGALLLASGLILGRAAAGDWHSASETVRDFVQVGWTAPALFGAATLVERWLRPSAEQPQRHWTVAGAAPAVAYLSLAAVWVANAGWW